MLENNDEVKTLQGFFNNHITLTISDPITVAFNDCIEKKFDDEVPDRYVKEIISDKLNEARKIILTTENLTLQKIVAITYFKRVAKIHVNEVIQ